MSEKVVDDLALYVKKEDPAECAAHLIAYLNELAEEAGRNAANALKKKEPREGEE